MEKIVKEFCIYDFEELAEDVKKKIIQVERDFQQECYCNIWLKYDMEEKARELVRYYFDLEKTNATPMYDLSYNQGSGAIIEFDINIVDLNNKYNIFTSEEIRFLTDKGIVNDIKVKHNNNHYYHEYTFGIDFTYYGMGYSYEDIISENYDITESGFNTLRDRVCDLLNDSDKHNTKSEFVKDIIEMNKELAKYGYGCIDYWQVCAESEVIDFVRNNDCKYYENGDVY